MSAQTQRSKLKAAWWRVGSRETDPQEVDTKNILAEPQPTEQGEKPRTKLRLQGRHSVPS